MTRLITILSVATVLVVASQKGFGVEPATLPVNESLPANLPDVLVSNDGSPVTTAEQWKVKRRPELLDLFAHEMYGTMPGRPAKMRFDIFESESQALGGNANRKQIAVLFNGDPGGPRMDLLIYLPNQSNGKVPLIFGMNFSGNAAVTVDPAVHLSTKCLEHGTSNRASTSSRGVNSIRWPIEQLLARGYGFATACRCDIDPDTPEGYAMSIKAMFPELQNRGDNFSTVGAWAWAMCRAMDYFQQDPGIDSKRVALMGWSRLGKAALWAAAVDERFALLIDSESGAGGAKLFHHDVGENIRRLNTVFPHWYCQNFRKYNDRDTTMPFDMHMVVALVAPRPIYSANSDGNFDFVGEFLSLKAAEPVYKLLGKTGLPAEHIPALNSPTVGYLGYHRRTGHHDVLPYDWEQYLKFCDASL